MKHSIKPMKHQQQSLDHAERVSRVLDLSDAGTGKTAVAVWHFGKMRKRKKGALLVICPRTLMHNVWAMEFQKLYPEFTVSVAGAANREKAFKADADVYVTNFDAATWLAKRPASFFARFYMLVIDELTAYKNKDSQRSRALARIVQHFECRRGLTATPIGESVTDIWHQAYLIDDGVHLGKEFYKFRGTVCSPVTQTIAGRKITEWEDIEGAEEAIYGVLLDMTVRHQKEKCTDIPPTFYTHVEYELSKRQRELYDEMLYGRVLKKEHGITGKITGKHGGLVAAKLSQICSGAVYDDDKLVELIDVGRYELVMELAAQRVRPVIFYEWRHQLDELMKQAKARGLRYGSANGSTSDRERDQLFADYQAKRLDGLILHPDIAAHGVTLTAGTSIIWPQPIRQIEPFVQANQRQARIGQKFKTEIVMVQAKDTVEEAAYGVLMERDAKLSKLLALFGE